jgi:glycerol-3-phosphate cytidylyltransferase-like family protein
MGEYLELIEQTLLESFDIVPKDENAIPVVVVHGRYSIPHAGHLGLWDLAFKEGKKKGAKKLIIAIVYGEKSSKDKDKNPTTFEERKHLIDKVLKGTPHDVIKLNNGFIGVVINELRKKGYEPIMFASGPDREDGYKSQLQKYSKEWDVNADITSVQARIKGASATEVRSAIRNDDRETFEKFMPKALYPEWENLKKILSR